MSPPRQRDPSHTVGKELEPWNLDFWNGEECPGERGDDEGRESKVLDACSIVYGLASNTSPPTMPYTPFLPLTRIVCDPFHPLIPTLPTSNWRHSWQMFSFRGIPRRWLEREEQASKRLSLTSERQMKKKSKGLDELVFRRQVCLPVCGLFQGSHKCFRLGSTRYVGLVLRHYQHEGRAAVIIFVLGTMPSSHLISAMGYLFLICRCRP